MSFIDKPKPVFEIFNGPPPYVMRTHHLPSVFGPMMGSKRQQWINWAYLPIAPRKGETATPPTKYTKKPFIPAPNKPFVYPASPTNPKHWRSYGVARSISELIGFVLTAEITPKAPAFVCLDYDLKTLVKGNSEHDEQRRIMLDIWKRAGTHSHESPSGKGSHQMFAITDPDLLDMIGGGIHSKVIPMEIYGSEHYMTITPNLENDLPIVNGNDFILKLLTSEFFTTRPLTPDEIANPRTVSVFQRKEPLLPSQPDNRTIEQVVATIAKWKNADLFYRLMRDKMIGSEPQYLRADGTTDSSKIDQALANIVATATRNHELALSIMRRSVFYRETKARYDTAERYDHIYLLNTLSKKWHEMDLIAAANSALNPYKRKA